VLDLSCRVRGRHRCVRNRWGGSGRSDGRVFGARFVKPGLDDPERNWGDEQEEEEEGSGDHVGQGALADMRAKVDAGRVAAAVYGE
jgi:hypothetical protein